MTHIEVTTSVVITDSIGRHRGTVINTAQADAPDERYVMTFARGAIQSTEHQIAAALIAQFGEHPEAEPARTAARERMGAALAYAGGKALARRDRAEALRGTNAVAPFAQGHYVELLDGEHAGRRGRIYETQHSQDEISTATIELEPPGRPDDPSEPIVVTGVRFDAMDLVN